jgi:hypothetical protein
MRSRNGECPEPEGAAMLTGGATRSSGYHRLWVRSTWTRRLSVWAAFAVALFVLCSGAAHATDGPVLQDLSSLDQLRSAFERDAGKPRVILLLSPT